MSILQHMGKRILFTVLDWGLGHATRSIPVIHALADKGCDVIIASDNMALEFLKAEFPQFKAHALPSYGVKYSYKSLLANTLSNSKNITDAMRKEHRLTNELIRSEKVDALITDNRYGCYSTDVPAVIITHQLKFKTGSTLLNKASQVMVNKWLAPFDKVWVPDDEKRSLTGALSESNDPRTQYIGWQSTVSSRPMKERYKLVAILSGPEPQRTYLENEIRPQLESLGLPCALVRGVPGSDEPRQQTNLTAYDKLDREGIDRIINESSTIFCRTGYSSLMDLRCAGKKAILVPTPAQPEQLFLGDVMQQHDYYVVQQQGKIDIASALESLESTPSPAAARSENSLLDNAIDELLSLIKAEV